MLTSLLPPSVREAAYRRKFLENREENLFMGSFESFAAAEAGAPPTKLSATTTHRLTPSTAIRSPPTTIRACSG